ncbi:MAG: aminotransferase [Alphaproteobacteria bacterium]|jgi:L-2,4-diaminobutyrate transaminase|nr:aminotransferase [Alphaproteobacteria bacterium]
MSPNEAPRNLSLDEMDKQSLLHPYTSIADHQESGSVVVAGGSGARVRDMEGREYLDAMGGLWCVNIGYGRQEMADTIAEQAGKLAYYHLFFAMAQEPAIRLADKVLSVMPEHMSKVFFCNSGSEANDTQVKIVWYYNNLRGKPEKRKFISRQGAYHGVTVAAASLTGLPPIHNSFNLPLPGFLHTSSPHAFWNKPEGMSERDFSAKLAQDLDDLIEKEGPDTVAAFIAEPVMGAGGVIVPPEGYFEAIQPVLKKHDVLFIADEVICGFGRMGTWFGSNYFNLEPDMISIAKGLTSAYVPMSAAVISEKVWDVLKDGSPEIGPFAHGYTYGGHPIAAAAGLKTIEIMQREDLVGAAAKVAPVFQSRLREAFADHPLVGEVRGAGLLAAIELIKDKSAKTPFELASKVGPRLAAKLMDEGMINRGVVNSVCFSPPLVINEADVDEMVSKFERALGSLAKELAANGEWSAP